MTTDEKLAGILAAVQTDPGNRGLARDPHDNLFTATAGDFAAACRSIAVNPAASIAVWTGFFIPTADPPAYETDGPLGAVFLQTHLEPLGIWVDLVGPSSGIVRAMATVLAEPIASDPKLKRFTHELWLEHPGPSFDGRCYSMRGRDITEYSSRWLAERMFGSDRRAASVSIGIGDGGNEIGMGKVPHETVVKNIPNGHLIHCRVPTDHLIVAGVSNWGAYALAAGLFVLREVKPPPDLFDSDAERRILEVMVEAGPLVDGVTGKQTATVDGLTWDEYAEPLVRIRGILEA